MSLLYAELSRGYKLRCRKRFPSPVSALFVVLTLSFFGLAVQLHHASVLNFFSFIMPVKGSDTVPLNEMPPLLESMRKKNIGRFGQSPIETSTCSYSMPPPHRMVEEPFRWQPVLSKSKAKAYVFSAFYDPRIHPAVVTIIGLASEYEAVQDGDRQRFCRMWFSGEEKPRTVAAVFRFVPETHGFLFAAVLYSCPTPSPPYAVSLISSCTETAGNLLKVVHQEFTDDHGVGGKRLADYRHHTVCNGVMHSNYSSFQRLVEIIEFNRMFGAQRIVFYLLSSSPEVKLVLDSYERDGIVEIIPWHTLPPNSSFEEQPEFHNFRFIEARSYAQVAAVNDCLYRNLFRSTFVLFTDFDEITVPRDASLGDNWSNVLERATRDWLARFATSEDRFPGVYMLRSVFFPQDTLQLLIEQNDFSTMNDWLRVNNYTGVHHNFRESFIYPHNVRSKYFVWPKVVVMTGVHFPHELLTTTVDTVYVNKRLCLVHHLRESLVPLGAPSAIEDDWMARYSQNITKQIHDRRSAISNYLTRDRQLS